MKRAVKIAQGVLSEALTLAREQPLQECCGLLAGPGNAITHIFPAVNALASPTAYEIAPEELFRLMREMRAAGIELMGIYHSHPSTKNEPSRRDIERAYYPDAAYFILSPQPESSRPVRAFSIREGHVEELGIEVV